MAAASNKHGVVNDFERKQNAKTPNQGTKMIQLAMFVGLLYAASLLRESVNVAQIVSEYSFGDLGVFGLGPTEKTSSCTEYRPFPFPDHNTGLPYLGDAFASSDAQFVNFVGINRGECRKEFNDADRFSANQMYAGHRFMCVFDGTVHVISEFIHHSVPHEGGFVIRCKIPSHLQHLVQAGQIFTSLHVDLHAIEDLEMKRKGRFQIQPFPSSVVTETPAIKDIPVCYPFNIDSDNFQLTAMTMIKSEYSLNKKIENYNQSRTSSNSRLQEWIEYHHYQGFDHFIIYDNDEKPHGPIESLVKPYVDQGLATYRWFPLPACICDRDGGMLGMIKREGQMAGSVAALHRWSSKTKFFAHMDVDEFFVPFQNKTVLDIVQEGDTAIDVFAWKPTVMAPCNGTLVAENESILLKWKCITDWHYADIKLIMRASRIMFFAVHYPIVTMDWEKPRIQILNWTNEGFLAHYRESPGLPWWQNQYSGQVLSKFQNETNIMNNFLEHQKQKFFLLNRTWS
jgi:hypothetical protein